MVFDYGFNVETAGDHPVWHQSERDALPGHQQERDADPTVEPAAAQRESSAERR
jgi:hypothetical protein